MMYIKVYIFQDQIIVLINDHIFMEDNRPIEPIPKSKYIGAAIMLGGVVYFIYKTFISP